MRIKDTDTIEDFSSLAGQSSVLDDPLRRLDASMRRRALRLFFSASAVLLILGSAVLWRWQPSDGGFERTLPSLATLVVGILCGLCRWRLPARHGALTSFVLMVAIMALSAYVADMRGMGLYSINLSLLSFIVAAGTILLGLRAGAALALCACAVVLLLVWRSLGAGPVLDLSHHPMEERAVTHLFLIAVALTVGAGALRMTRRATREAGERNALFRDLLSMAADWYWEMDREYRFTQLSEERPGASGLSLEKRRGRTPWEISDMGISDEDLDALRADLEAHRPLRGVIARRIGPDGQPLFLSISGEPRFDAQGNFNGYWGVGRDVSSEMRAEQAIRATEARYRELFRRSPSPQVLHRWGRVLDANAAAMALFGYTQRSSIIGQDLFTHYEPGDEQRARERAAKIERMPLGGMLPAEEFQLQTLSRRRRVVNSTSVRVDAEGGPATLSFFIDQTETSRAQEALRSSESLLSHLVAMSPDVVTLTEQGTGRYLMVNKTWEQLTGYTREEAIGRSAEDLDLFLDQAQREAVRERLRSGEALHAMPCVFKGKQGQLINVQMSAALFEVDGRGYVVTNSRDVTERERRRLVHEAILSNASIGICLTRGERFVQVNRLVEDMFGFENGSLTGRHSSAIWANPAEHAAEMAELAPRLAAGQQIEIERSMRRQDGTDFICRILGKAVDPANPDHGGTIWIMEDVSERRRVEAALAQAKDEAQAASRAKSAFLANTSHELRTPLNGLVGLARMLQQPQLSTDERQGYLDQMLDSAESLSGLISDILDLAKIEAGRLTLEAQPFGLRDMLASVGVAYLTLADTRGLRFTMEIDEAVPAWVLGDQLRLRQVLSNFLSNALKFTTQGGITLRVLVRPKSSLRFEVSDTGPGIDPAQHARLFEPFTQADESTTRRYGGTGLGLSISRELTALMGGSVGLVSKPGQGATFWAELPLPAFSAPQGGHGRSPIEQRALREFEGARVLMVEDHPVNMLIAVAQLQQWGLQVEQAHDGVQAIESVRAAAARGEPFDAVLMDVQMPVMGGHEATREIRREFDAEALPIIALTAAALSSERDEALAAGMNDFLTKPIDAQRLHATLLRLVGRRPSAMPQAANGGPPTLVVVPGMKR
ncbi:MAG: PAS domain S-box protein [Paucibacter sp.]|nr:PAS domain S-box protein [Roseateles sp.]